MKRAWLPPYPPATHGYFLETWSVRANKVRWVMTTRAKQLAWYSQTPIPHGFLLVGITSDICGKCWYSCWYRSDSLFLKSLALQETLETVGVVLSSWSMSCWRVLGRDLYALLDWCWYRCWFSCRTGRFCNPSLRPVKATCCNVLSLWMWRAIIGETSFKGPIWKSFQVEIVIEALRFLKAILHYLLMPYYFKLNKLA